MKLVKSKVSDYYSRYVVDSIMSTISRSSIFQRDIVVLKSNVEIRSSNGVPFTLKDGAGCIELTTYESLNTMTGELSNPSSVETFYPSSDMCNDQVLCFLDWLDQRLEEAKS
jgi:hypothetical protein